MEETETDIRTVAQDGLTDQVDPEYENWIVLGPFYGGSQRDVVMHDEVLERLGQFDDAVQSVDMLFGDDHVLIVVNPAVPEAVREATRLLGLIRSGDLLNEPRIRDSYVEQMFGIWRDLTLEQRITILRDGDLPVSLALKAGPPDRLPIEVMAELCDY